MAGKLITLHTATKFWFHFHIHLVNQLTFSKYSLDPVGDGLIVFGFELGFHSAGHTE